MKTLLALIALAVLAGAAPRSSGADTSETADAAALAWLALVDAGNYAQSWNTAAAYATETVTPMQDPDGHWRMSGYYIR